MESESALGHAGLLQLLGPVRHHLDGIPERQRRAVEAAVDWGEREEAADDRYLVSAGTLSLLARAAEECPVFVVVDDFHWLDPESAAAVLFAARRLAHDPVAFLIATRHGSPAGTSLDGLDTLALTGLTPSDSADLFPPGTDPTVIDRLVAATHGNPLALIEIVKRLSPAQRRGAAELADPLPTGDAPAVGVRTIRVEPAAGVPPGGSAGRGGIGRLCRCGVRRAAGAGSGSRRRPE